jgi:hypothetical protein
MLKIKIFAGLDHDLERQWVEILTRKMLNVLSRGRETGRIPRKHSS